MQELTRINYFQNMIRLTYFVLTCVWVASGYRLPRDVIPEHYKLEIISYLGVKDDFDFDGKVWIQVSTRVRYKDMVENGETKYICTKNAPRIIV